MAIVVAFVKKRKHDIVPYMKHLTPINILGWIGVLLVLDAYALLSFGVIDAGLAFQIPTLFGSLAVAVEAWVKRDHQPAILNVIFAIIAAIAIIRLLLGH